MLLIGLTGGIGSGKSTVSALLGGQGRGDHRRRRHHPRAAAAGHRVFDAMVERFGDGIVAADGTLDRPAVADMVFNDAAALKDLEAIVHPAVGVEIARRLEAERDTDHLVVLDVPLLVESGRDDMAALVVVDVDPEIAVARLVEHRGMREADARARIASQVVPRGAAGEGRPRDRQLRHARGPRRAQIDELVAAPRWPGART